ncbi:MAG: 2-oxo acid dehydrogenase subunit E2 [Verrucomicrobia bacterium]|nr:2-oxo acid dehydrogenase subunit E2 [Verrucomicrobiota bacterium]MDE3099059.1 2-oxo acid dehydrogenase subunit E2 [Verrucomicrobiota bacterium]
MATPIIMPKFGQMTEESAIVEWLKKEGDKVGKGDVLFTVETDKSVMEVQSFEEGALLKIIVPPRVNVPVQSTVGFLGTPGEPIPAVTPPAPAPAAPKPAAAPAPGRPAMQPITAPVAAAILPQSRMPAASPQAPAIFRISPRAAALARDCVIDPSGIPGTGPEGRVVEKDVRNYLRQSGYDNLRISPAAKQKAALEKLDILAVARAADGERVTLADVDRALAERPRAMSKMRQTIAQRLWQSVVTAPHFFVTVAVDMTDLLALRADLKAKGAPLTVTDFISEAVVLALKEFPDVNSTTDGKTVQWRSRVHLGIAVSLEQGLVVPVIRNADELTLLELNRSARELADKARAGKLGPDDMIGGTFTISNMGMMDVENFTAIINPGESAILAVSSTVKKAVVLEDRVVVRSIMKITLSSDHRIVDGAMAARFVNAIKQKLEDIELWKHLTS